MDMKIKVENKTIGDRSPVFVVAEAGINHNGNIKTAKKLIEKASDSEADAIKFQTFKAKHLATKESKFYKILKKYELEEDDFGELKDYAKSKSIIFFSTPTNEEATDLLSKLKVSMYKVASGNLTNIPLLNHIAKKKKPIIISTGMANLLEIQDAIRAIKSMKNNKIIIMHSVTAYPTPIDQVNLNTIKNLSKKFNFPIGFSDNGFDELVPIIAVAKGAKVIEKHFTLSKKLKGPDHSMSTEPKNFKEMIENIRSVEQMLGNGIKKCQPCEKDGLINARRSLVSDQIIPKNTKITYKMIRIKRPATGIPPKYLQRIIGKTAKKNILNDKPIKWSDLK